MSHFPTRIVSLQPSATVTLDALGLLDRVVACTKYCADVVPDVLDGNRLIVHDSWTAQASQILAAKPDLVIASVPYQEQAVIEILKAGLPFLALSPHSLADVYSDMAMIAGIVGVPERAEKLIGEMQREIEEVRQKAARPAVASQTGMSVLHKPRVYCEEWGKPLIHSQLWVKELVEAAGGEFIGDPGKHTDADTIRAANPDVIIAAWCGAGDRVPLEKIIRERQWQETKAAKNGRVYCIRDEYLNTPAPTLVKGLHALACAIWPELFGEDSSGIVKPRQIGKFVAGARMTIFDDAQRRPDLFCWFGAISLSDIQEWSARTQLDLPSDLLAFWQETGGGDLFESETILRPSVSETIAPNFVEGDDTESRNTAYRSSGLPNGLFVFHVGMDISAIDLRSNEYVTVAERNGFSIAARFTSFDDWYSKTLRAEFAKKYNLEP